MKKLLYILVLFLLGGAATYAYELHVDTVRISHSSAGEIFYSHQYIVTVTNTDTDTLWIWFDYKDDNHNEDYNVRRYLIGRKKGADFSIYDLLIASDINISDRSSYYISSAIKRLFLNQKFTIIVYDQSLNEKPFDVPSILRGIRIYRQQEVFDACPYIKNLYINNSYRLDEYTYPYDTFVYPIFQLSR